MKPSFSRRTVVAGIELMERMTHAELTRSVLKWGPDFLSKVGDENLSVSRRLNNLIKLLDEEPLVKTAEGDFLQEAVVDESFARFRGPDEVNANLSVPQEAFRRALELDGFRLSDGAIRPAVPAELRTADAADDVSQLLMKHGFLVPQGHLKQALDAHRRSDWAAANSQIRSFLESLFDELAVKIDPTASTISTGENRRAKLGKDGFLYGHLNEWSNDGKNFINGLMKRLHPHGSHPGLSDEADSTFRLQIVVLTAKLLLERFDKLP